MRVDTTPTVPGNRRSVRITTTYSYTGGLVLLDAVHMPTGCGTRPAFWSNGPNWPVGGEIDIVEGVNDYADNQATIHTSHGCTIASADSATLGISGNVVGGTNCAAAETGNAGCGMTATQSNSYGAGFNNNGGGVYASAFFYSLVLSYVYGLTDTAAQCNGWTRASPSGSSRGTTSRPTSPPTPRSRTAGGLPWPSGPRRTAPRSSSSTRTRRSSTPPFGTCRLLGLFPVSLG